MNITNDNLYNTDDLVKIIAKNTNNTLFIIYNQNKDSSYNLENNSFHNFTTNDKFYQQIIKIIKSIYSCKDTFELSINNNQIDIRLFGYIIEITNIPNLKFIYENY